MNIVVTSDSLSTLQYGRRDSYREATTPMIDQSKKPSKAGKKKKKDKDKLESLKKELELVSTLSTLAGCLHVFSFWTFVVGTNLRLGSCYISTISFINNTMEKEQNIKT